MDTGVAADRIADVVRRYGRHALTDAVALRAALRETSGDAFTVAELDALAAVAAVPELAPDRIAAGTDLPDDHIRWAAAVLVAALRPRVAAGEATATMPEGEPTLPPWQPTSDDHHLRWDDGRRTVPRTRRLPLWRRRWSPAALVVAAVLALAAVAAGTATALLGRDAGTAPPADRYAVDQVAQRYRALGARLLDGVARCAQLPAEPGEVERVTCDVGTYTLTLATYDAPSRLPERRDGIARAADLVRQARTTEEGAAVAMQEDHSGRSTVYWDVDSPRPVSATATAERTGLPALAAFYDARQFGAIQRPEVPGPAFASGLLWRFAQRVVDNEQPARCVSDEITINVTELVKCPLADGGQLTFALAPDRAALQRTRVEFAGNGGKVPGTVQVRIWNNNEPPLSGQLIPFVSADDNSPAVYWDDDATLTWGVFFGNPGVPLDAHIARWSR